LTPERERISSLLAKATLQLAQLAQASPRLEAETLLGTCLEQPRSHLYAWPNREVPPEALSRFLRLMQRRLTGEPLAYILGRREFWSLDLLVSPATLIPRPETELLVELTLALLPEHTPQRVLDLGTGCGAIAAALAWERPDWSLSASDVSPAALAVARSNFERLGLRNVRGVLGDWYQALPAQERFHLIVSNPPYVATVDPHLTRGDLPWEPRCALAAGPDGLDAIRSILAGAAARLEPPGWLLLEHGFDQGPSVRSLLQRAGFREIQTHADLVGLERATLGRL
jgi:release factor glutamine methyltransferase